jgi:hypothetical protein
VAGQIRGAIPICRLKQRYFAEVPRCIQNGFARLHKCFNQLIRLSVDSRPILRIQVFVFAVLTVQVRFGFVNINFCIAKPFGDGFPERGFAGER